MSPPLRHEIRYLVTEIASALGQGWTIDATYESNHAAMLLGPDEARVLLNVSDLQRSGKVHFQGTFPRTTKGHARHEIGVSRDRGPEVIAREIAWRLLPKYTEELAAVLVYNLEADAAYERRIAVAQELTTLLPDCQEPINSADRSVLSFRTPAGHWGTVDLFSDVSAGITIHSISVNVLRQIAHAVREQ